MMDFMDDDLTNGLQPGMSTPLESEIPPLLGGEDGDGEVANVLLDDEEVVPVMREHVKLD